jgi:predicted  nucleic acid-binding Zn-ribbon protein
LSENSKQEALLNELSAVYSQVVILVNKYKDVSSHNAGLEKQLMELRESKNVLNEKIIKLEGELNKFQNDADLRFLNSLNEKERENLKTKIESLISRINFHLSAEQSR